jgi:CheY-like chemotaxis protein
LKRPGRCLEQQHLQLEVSLPRRPIQIEGDSIRIEQIMVNLLTNATKYTNPHGRVWVGAAVENQEAVIRVRDTGVGIPPEMLERIFELFTQADQASDRPLQWGMGVGLSLVRSFVKLHGGTVKATSAGPGAGSEFQINFPLLQNAQQGMDPSREPAPTGSSVTDRPCKVLLAEDHADSADCIAKMLKLWGHEVRVVGDGPAALAAAEEFVPDVMLLDIGLPGMNGYEVAKKLRGQAALNETLIVALTGFGREEDRERAFDAGFNCHVTKPIEPEALRKLVSQICRRQHAQV